MDKNNKRQFFNIFKNIRSSKACNYPATLKTPTGMYHGIDTLEGFTADAEHLGRTDGENSEFENEFYKVCKLDNHYIFEFKGDEAVKIPEMKLKDLEKILNNKMKLNKACDIYKLTVEHLRFSGHQSKQVLLRLLNDIISNIYYLTCPQVKLGLSTASRV